MNPLIVIDCKKETENVALKSRPSAADPLTPLFPAPASPFKWLVWLETELEGEFR